jgi:hypothetical protein
MHVHRDRQVDMLRYDERRRNTGLQEVRDLRANNEHTGYTQDRLSCA